MKAYKFLVLFFLLNACGSVLAEEIYFSCSTKSGIAVLQMNDNNLEYSFDKKRRTIFLFKSKKLDNGSFKYNHYSRFQADYFNVSFINDDYKYLVFSNYEDGQQSQGVTVLNLNNKKEFTYHCRTTDIDRLSELSSKLQCDRSSSLGCQ